MPIAAPVKLGILSTADIGKAVLSALKYVPNCVCAAVASRSLEKAQRFASENGIPIACTYEDMFGQDLNAIYIPLPTALSTEWAVRFASAGMHVLVDKPFASAEDVQRIIDACSENNVIFMDATHFVHSSRTTQVKEKLRDGVIGDVKRIFSTFGAPIQMAGNIRADPKLEPMGALGDLGWYVMRSFVTYIGVERASNILSVSCTAKYHPNFPGSIESVEGVLVLGTGEHDRLSLNFIVDGATTFVQDAVIWGTRGQIEVPQFLGPYRQIYMLDPVRKEGDFSTDTDIIIHTTVGSFDEKGDPVACYPSREVQVVKEVGGLTHPAMMIREFSRMIIENDLVTGKRYAAESLAAQKLVDAVFQQVKQ